MHSGKPALKDYEFLVEDKAKPKNRELLLKTKYV